MEDTGAFSRPQQDSNLQPTEKKGYPCDGVSKRLVEAGQGLLGLPRDPQYSLRFPKLKRGLKRGSAELSTELGEIDIRGVGTLIHAFTMTEEGRSGR